MVCTQQLNRQLRQGITKLSRLRNSDVSADYPGSMRLQRESFQRRLKYPDCEDDDSITQSRPTAERNPGDALQTGAVSKYLQMNDDRSRRQHVADGSHISLPTVPGFRRGSDQIVEEGEVLRYPGVI